MQRMRLRSGTWVLFTSSVAISACSDSNQVPGAPVTNDTGNTVFMAPPSDLNDVNNDLLSGNVEDFEGNPITSNAASATSFSECAGVVQRAEALSRPTDIIFIVDNSSSMDGEIRQIQDRINQDFAAIIDASGVDYRVILLSRYGSPGVLVGDTDNGICIGGALGGQACTDPAATPLANTARFFHYSTDVRSRELWCRALEGYGTPDELTTDTERPNWTPLAPGGWSQYLRPNTFKTFVAITDDDSHCGPDVEPDNRAPFRDVNGQPFDYNFDDGNSAQQGEQAAEDFDAALLALSPEHFGTATSRNYNWYSIVGMAENDPGNAPWTPDQPIQEGTCGTNAESEGAATGHQALSVMTGGLRWPSCRNDDFNTMFQAIAGGVVNGALACDWDIPPLNEGEFNPTQVNVIFTPTSGNKKLGHYVASEGDCSPGGWYLDDVNDPQRIIACQETCNVLKSDATGQINLVFGCDQISDIR